MKKIAEPGHRETQEEEDSQHQLSEGEGGSSQELAGAVGGVSVWWSGVCWPQGFQKVSTIASILQMGTRSRREL